MRKILIAMLGLIAACSDSDSVTPDAGVPDARPDPVARGSYLMNTVLACVDCHTPRLPSGAFDLSKQLSGVECLVDTMPPADNGVGCLHSRNLTPHATGLATRTDEQIKNMFQNGMRPDGKILANVMPYWLLHNLTPDDADAIVAYLRTLTPVDHMVPANEAPWEDNAAAPIAQDSEFPAAGGTGATHDSALRGRYIAKLICVDCHSPDLPPGSSRPIDLTKPLQGGRAFPAAAFNLPQPPFPDVVYSVNLTPHATGLAGWTVANVVTALKQGKDKDGMNICPPMPAGPMGPFKDLTDGDATDVANYILNLAPVENMIPNTCVAP